MSTHPKRSQRVKKPIIRLEAEQAAAAEAATARAGKKKKRQKEEISSPAAASSNAATENNTASTTDGNIGIYDGAEFFNYISNEDDDNCHESELTANYEEYTSTQANAKDAEAEYTLKRLFKNGSTSKQRSKMFLKPSEENVVAAAINESGDRFNFLDECEKVDGESNECRAKEGLAALDKKTRSKIGYRGQANQYEVSGRLNQDSDEWYVIEFCPVFSGCSGREKPLPGSLVDFCGGDVHHLNNLKPGDPPRYHRQDENGDHIFKIRRVCWRTENRNDIIEKAKRNAHVRDACIRRRDELVRLHDTYGIQRHPLCRGHYYEVTKKGNPTFGCWRAKSLNNVMAITGNFLVSGDPKFDPDKEANHIGDEMLPDEMNQEVSLTTVRGTFSVTRVSLERFESTELQTVSDHNKPALDADLALMRRLFGPSTNHGKLKYYFVRKVGKGAKAWGTKPFHSWREMMKHVGQRDLSSKRKLTEPDDLPQEIGEEKTIETNRGKFKVKRVTLEKYLERYPKN